MSPRKQQLRRKNRSNKLRKLVPNLGTFILFLLVVGFVGSGVDRMFFNEGLETEFPDLSTLIIKTPYEKKTGHKIKVEIWKGCGIPKLARMYTNYLRSEGIDVLDSKNADNFDYVESKILHHRGELERALELANILMIDKKKIIEDKDENLYFDLTLILGKDYLNLASYRHALLHQQPF